MRNMGGDILNVRKDLVIAVLLGFFLAVTLYPQVTGVGEYDPWSDINSDGKMRVDDILDVALRFGSNGDPTRNVTVVNWPNSSEVTVWYNDHIAPNSFLSTDHISASGFGQLHVIVTAWNLAPGETLSVEIHSTLWNIAHTLWTSFEVYRITLSSASLVSSLPPVMVKSPSTSKPSSNKKVMPFVVSSNSTS